MIDNYIIEHPSYQYAQQVVNREIIAGKYIIKECEKFLRDLEDEDSKYFLDVDAIKVIDNLTGIINMADGVMKGKPTREALAPFQWYFIINALCWKHKKNPEKRRYEKSVLLIARKSGKSFLVGLIFTILLLMEDEYSEFYSVAPDRELSSIVKQEIEKTIQESPAISKYFKLVKSEIRCELKKSKMIALATSNNRMDGRKANVYVADEVNNPASYREKSYSKIEQNRKKPQVDNSELT